MGGLLIGGIYAMIALGLTLIFGVSRILNIAHGDFVTLGSVFALGIVLTTSASPFLALLLIPPAFLAVGVAFERLLVKRVILKSKENMLAVSILVTLAFSMIVEDGMFFSLGRQGLNYIGLQLLLPPIDVMGIALSSVRTLSLAAVIFLTLITRFIIMGTSFGRMLRATVQDRELAEVLGVNVGRVTSLSFGLGIVLAAIAGLFMALITNLTAFIGLQLTVTALAVVILGGLGSFVGSLLGGFIIGVAEAYTAFYIGTNWSPITAILALIIILVIRPSGLFGGRT